MPRGVEVVVAIIGTLKLGAIYVPIFTGFRPDAIRFRLDHCRAKVLVTHHEATAQLPAGMTARIICVSQPGTKLPTGYLDFYAEIEREAADFFCVLAIGTTLPLLSTRPDRQASQRVAPLRSIFRPRSGPTSSTALISSATMCWPTGDPGWGYGFVCYLGALAAGGTVISVQQNPTAELCLAILQTYSRNQSRHDADAATQPVGRGRKTLRAADIRLRALSSCRRAAQRQSGRVVSAGLEHHADGSFRRHGIRPAYWQFQRVSHDGEAGFNGSAVPGFSHGNRGEDGSELPAERSGSWARGSMRIVGIGQATGTIQPPRASSCATAGRRAISVAAIKTAISGSRAAPAT